MTLHGLTHKTRILNRVVEPAVETKLTKKAENKSQSTENVYENIKAASEVVEIVKKPIETSFKVVDVDNGAASLIDTTFEVNNVPSSPGIVRSSEY